MRQIRDARLDREGNDFRTLENATRVCRAHEMLAGTGASVTEIAAELGYTAPANFARAFRKATGASPGEGHRRLAGAGPRAAPVAARRP